MLPTKHTRRHNLLAVVAAIILTLQNGMIGNLSGGMGGSTTQPTQAKVQQPQAQEQIHEIPTLGLCLWRYQNARFTWQLLVLLQGILGLSLRSASFEILSFGFSRPQLKMVWWSSEPFKQLLNGLARPRKRPAHTTLLL